MQTLSTIQQADIVRLMQSRQMQRLILVINALLVVWIAAQLAGLTWQFIAPAEQVQQEVVDTGSAPVQRNEETVLIRQLPDWHLLGVVTQQAAAPVRTDVPKDAPDTQLKLVLRGSLSSDDQKHARAIIADPRGNEEQYAIGDNLPGNAELSEIYPDRVILERNGRYETLRLPQDQDNRKSPVNITARSSRPAASAATPAQRLEAISRQVRKNPKTLYEVVRPVPKQDEQGNLVGYTLQPGRDKELFEQLGLQSGDIAVQINDQRLDDPTSSAAALKSIQDGAEVTMTVLRDGQEQVMSFSLPAE